MKSILFALLFLFIPKLAISQVSEKNELIINPNDKLIYLDSTDTQTNSKNFLYIRVIKDSKLKKERYVVQEYYRSGILRMQGTSKDYDGYSKDGDVTYYYKNGTKKLEGKFINDEKNHISQLKINQFWDVNGVQKITDGNGFFEDKDENEYSKGEIKNGLKDGVWEGSLVHPTNFIYIENYSDGKLISGTSTDKNGVQTIYYTLEKKPEPKNGMQSFYGYIARNFKVPETPNGLRGKIYVKFVVDKDGKIVEPKILRDLGYGTGEEAIRVLTEYNEFTPGEQRGQKVRCAFSLPIAFGSSR